MKLREQPAPDYRTSAAFMDNDGQVLANVHVNLSPAISLGDFRLPVSVDAERIQRAASLQTSDGKQFRITDLRLCPGYHSVAPDQPHFEFHFQAV
jgi:hypothetical protein